jgi:cell division protein FtsA
VITGGGAILNGIVEVAEQVFNAPVRLGAPAGFDGLLDEVAQPLYAAAFGLVLYGLRCELGISGSGRSQNRRTSVQPIKDRVKSFFGIRR